MINIIGSIDSYENSKENKTGNELFKVLNTENLKGNKEAILKNLKENHIKTEENKEKYGQKGKIVHINLPATGNFEGLKFDYFVSDRRYNKRMYGTIEENPIVFKNRPDIENESFTVEEISDILKALNDYLRVNGVILDKNINFEKDLQDDKFIYRCGTSDCLKEITGLNDKYFLNSKNRVGDYWLECTGKQFCFCKNGTYDNNDARILTKVK